MNQNKLNLTQALVVEGKYDAARLANLVDATILTTDGFAIFKDKTMQRSSNALPPPGHDFADGLRRRSFKIRHYITGLVGRKTCCRLYPRRAR